MNSALQTEHGYQKISERERDDRAVRKGKGVYATPKTDQEKQRIEQHKKLMETMVGNRGWREARLQYEFSRGEQADHLFIKARHAPRAQTQPRPFPARAEPSPLLRPHPNLT